MCVYILITCVKLKSTSLYNQSFIIMTIFIFKLANACIIILCNTCIFRNYDYYGYYIILLCFVYINYIQVYIYYLLSKWFYCIILWAVNKNFFIVSFVFSVYVSSSLRRDLTLSIVNNNGRRVSGSFQAT